MNPQRRLSVSAVVGAMGIVYGDIGTSPLYALESALDAAGGFDAEAVLGVLSLVFWSLTISVTLKYVTVIMRADNEGEGGILALFALAQRRLIIGSTWAKVAVGLALAGTAFFFCDALITPAISVLGAVEGLEVLNPGLKSGVVPVTIIVIMVLFAYQRHGTASVARLFGPVMLLWFVVIGVIGVIPIVRSPQILLALNPSTASICWSIARRWRWRSSGRCSWRSPEARRCTRTWASSAGDQCVSPGSRWWGRRW